jgi:hypothetical protein
MPVHNRSHTSAGYFHHFHQVWSGAICDDLNAGRPPDVYYAFTYHALAEHAAPYGARTAGAAAISRTHRHA